ncbi:acetaldehyde dehydrogenase (acetylating) [Desulfosporosinus youngiae]|uniref:Acetaldehyde dehydrogenase (Acetylating) n=1 Tax=Desulfosporosinus youngiae DSM 17734 TaxID=768710 RepID=H5Y088_9FIRM|nr:acetaldehyde dehydrogenase (acetylating) [Desulfosporosinus youngiae]EHQ92067.1 acetaldehyde dehydrogenase (acetylating) [Desulfosporosinus youngiae DSM 17734]
MNRIDNDLLSVQEARILVENAREAQKILAAFPQEKLDKIVRHMAEAACKSAKELALLSHEETGFGKWQDKLVKNIFAGDFLYKKIKNMNVVGIINDDKVNKTMDIGVPVGVIAGLPPSTNPASTTIYKALLAVKSGNGIVFSPHPKAKKTISKTLDILIQAAEESGLPSGAIGYLRTLAVDGTVALMNHQDTSLILITGVPKMVRAAYTSGKPTIYGGPGNGPAFIERSADIKKAVEDIIFSRTFDNGIVPASEQSIVAESCIAAEVRRELRENGAYFMSEQESARLSKLFFRSDDSLNPEIVGKSALELAWRSGLAVPDDTKVLISEQKYVSPNHPYSREKLCPVLAFYVEKDWMNACEKCIELLINEGRGHTLVIHSKNEEVIREFALKKPVSRVLVNTPAALGGIGATTNLFPALTLGCGAAGGGLTSDNVSPMNLINIRKVGYGVRQIEDITAGVPAVETAEISKAPGPTSRNSIESTHDLKELLQELMKQLKWYGDY